MTAMDEDTPVDYSDEIETSSPDGKATTTTDTVTKKGNNDKVPCRTTRALKISIVNLLFLTLSASARAQ